MKRLPLALTSLMLGVIGLFLGVPLAATAADGITVDEQPQPGVVVIRDGFAVFTGTTTSDDSIFASVDGQFLTCDDYYSDTLKREVGDCWYIATIDGSTWDFGITSVELDRLGLPFLGPHEVRFMQADDTVDGTVITSEVTVTVEFVESLVEPSPSPSPSPSAAPPIAPAPTTPDHEATTSSRLVTGAADAPSVLSSLRTVADAVSSPIGLLASAAVTLVLLLLVALPTELLDQTLGQHYDRIMGRPVAWVKRVATGVTTFVASRLPATLRGVTERVRMPVWVPFAVGIALASIVAGFVDPGFGWNLGSVRVFASLVIMFVIESVLGWFVVRAIVRRTYPDIDPRPEFKYSSILILLVAVIVSRLVAFEPGMVFGLIEGLTFGIVLAGVREVRVTLVGLGWVTGLGLASWVGYSLLAGATGWLGVFTAETLSGLAIGCLAALPILLLPLAGFDGSVIFAWKRWVWVATYAVAVLMFFVVLLPVPESWGEVGVPLITWVGLFVAYAVFAVAVWAWFRFRAAPSQREGRTSETTTTS